MQVSVPLFRMAHLSGDGPSSLATCLTNPGKLITERSDLGQTFKTLELLAGITKRICGLTSILARKIRSIRNCREQCCLRRQLLRNQNLVTTGRLMIDSHKRSQCCKLKICQLVLCYSVGGQRAHSMHRQKHHWEEGRMGHRNSVPGPRHQSTTSQ